MNSFACIVNKILAGNTNLRSQGVRGEGPIGMKFNAIRTHPNSITYKLSIHFCNKSNRKTIKSKNSAILLNFCQGVISSAAPTLMWHTDLMQDFLVLRYSQV